MTSTFPSAFPWRGGLFALIALSLGSLPAAAQYAERSSLVGSGAADVDASGRSVKNPRVRAVHSDDPADVGSTAWMFERDPYLAYQLGRNINFREFRPRDGVFSDLISNLAGPMVDGTTAKITANNQTSCVGCHNLPQGTPGGGTNFHKDSGFGRNAPHYFGAGIMEMLAIQNRTTIMGTIDTDADGWVSVAESQAAPATMLIQPKAGAAPLDCGSPQLTGGSTGTPQFNSIVRVWYGLESTPTDGGAPTIEQVDASAIDGVTATHYNLEIMIWGWGQRAPPSALNPTNRAFTWDPFLTHTGLDSHDPSTLDDPDGDGVSRPTLAGAVQFPATHRAPDAGVLTDPLGFSRDDPDGDGVLTEISEGDLDLSEWFMLNAPRPAFAGTDMQDSRGRRIMEALDCTSCHVPDWDILPADGTYAGDRRFFDLDVAWDAEDGRLEGTLVELFDVVRGSHVRRLEGFAVEGLFSDLLQHDMGEGFAELAFDGNLNTRWRTPPLWGVGSGFPWGHDGQSLTLRDVILRHGGEAQASRDAFVAAPAQAQEMLLDWLRRQQLYDIETLPADVDGDGSIADPFMVAGMDTGPERFNAEWLFSVPVRIQGPVLNSDGVTIRSDAAVNLADAYGLTLPFRVDSDLDGWPDVWDAAPFSPDFGDGVP